MGKWVRAEKTNNFLDMYGDPNTFILTLKTFPITREAKSWENRSLDYFVGGTVPKA